jgi:uncharacterized membrane protein
MNTMRKSEIIVLAIILASFVIGIYVYTQLPETIATHWNAQGQVNGYMSKFWGLFLMPFISFVLFLLFIMIPKIDPLKQNIAKFRGYFDNFVVLVILFLFYIYLLSIFWNLGFTFNFVRALVPAFAILIFYTGILIEHTKRNWFIGIRTPWTMSSDKIWEKTHKVGGKLFKIVAIASLIGIFFEGLAFYLMLFLLFAGVIYVVAYSYFEFNRQHRRKK